jgi:hypothetical protein
MAAEHESAVSPRIGALMNAAPDFSLAPIGPPYDTVLALVPELRSRLASTLQPGVFLWGGELLNPDDAAGTHLLAKCVLQLLSLPCAQGFLGSAGRRAPTPS